MLEYFTNGRVLDLSDATSDVELGRQLRQIPTLEALASRQLDAKTSGEQAAAMEFVLEGLHQSLLLAKDEVSGGRSYRDMFEDMVKGLKLPKGKPKPPPRGK